MTHQTRTKSARTSEGTFKTLDQLMRQSMTVLQYGRLLASQQKASR